MNCSLVYLKKLVSVGISSFYFERTKLVRFLAKSCSPNLHNISLNENQSWHQEKCLILAHFFDLALCLFTKYKKKVIEVMSVSLKFASHIKCNCEYR